MGLIDITGSTVHLRDICDCDYFGIAVFLFAMLSLVFMLWLIEKEEKLKLKRKLLQLTKFKQEV